MNVETLGVKSLQARMIFWPCHIALNRLAQARQLPVAEVRADVFAGLNRGYALCHHM